MFWIKVFTLHESICKPLVNEYVDQSDKDHCQCYETESLRVE